MPPPCPASSQEEKKKKKKRIEEKIISSVKRGEGHFKTRREVGCRFGGGGWVWRGLVLALVHTKSCALSSVLRVPLAQFFSSTTPLSTTFTGAATTLRPPPSPPPPAPSLARALTSTSVSSERWQGEEEGSPNRSFVEGGGKRLRGEVMWG